MKPFVSLVAALVVAAACSKPPENGPGAPPPPSPVSVITLAPKPIEERSEYLATLTSRRAVSLYPQVSGYVRTITAKPGSTVAAGALLVQIDAAAEQASLDNLVATRESLVASASFANDRQARSKLLRGDGIVSQQDADQARVQADQAEASVRATDALISSQRARLSFFNILAPFSGIVGNVPVKVGDFVGPSVLLTSVTQDAGLEAEVWVPAERSTSLTPTSQVQLLDASGAVLAKSPVVFVSPRVDPATQLVLLKGAFETLPSLRPDQVVRARVAWNSVEALAVPTASVFRQAGQAFVYVVEHGDAGPGLHARRVPVSLGALVGSEYVVTRGLSAGQQVVISGVQQISDDSPVELQPATAR